MSSAAAKIQDYFNREADAYCAYYDQQAALASPIRRASRLLFKNAIHGRREAVIELCPQPFSQLKICELGCGGGHYSVELARRGAQVVGVDFAPRMIEQAKRLAEQVDVSDRCRFEQADIFAFTSPEPFDVVFATGVFEYIEPSRRPALVRKMKALSRRYVIASFPKQFHYHAMIRKVWLTLKGVPVWFFTSGKMEWTLRSEGLEPNRIIDVGILKVIRATI